MKTFLKNYTLPLASAMYAAFVVLFLCTFDRYSLNFISPETPFLNIAGIPFHRVEFIALLFCAAFAVGVGAGILLKKKARKLLPLCTAITGIIALLIGILDVDTMQQLLPTMRISHVIMTVSRLTGILLGLSGLFIGLSSGELLKHGKYLLSGIVVGGALSVFADAAGAFTTVYLFFGVAVIAVAVFLQCPKTEETATPALKTDTPTMILHYLGIFAASGAAALFAVVGYLYFRFSLDVSTIVYTVALASAAAIYVACSKLRFNNISKIIIGVLSLALWITAIVIPGATVTVLAVLSSAFLLGSCRAVSPDGKTSLLVGALGTTVFAIVACVLNHCLAEVIKYSGNRVIYEVSEYAWIVFVVLTAVVMGISLFTSRKNGFRIKQNPQVPTVK